MIGSLCSGIGGLDLAAEEVFGDRLAWYAEVDPFASSVMAEHWPGVPNLGDVGAVNWADVEPVQIVTAGFPCQDVSQAGKRVGLQAGNRSGLWFKVLDAIEAVAPAIVAVENVPALRRQGGLDVVLIGLARLGFDAEWGTLRASDVGAPHRRDRLFVVAGHPDRQPWPEWRSSAS